MNLGNELDLLFALFDKVNAREFALFIEPELTAVLSALVPFSKLKEHGVSVLIPLTEEASATPLSADLSGELIYLLRPTPSSIALAAKSIKVHNQSRTGSQTMVIITPQIEPSVSHLFTKFGVLGDVDLQSWPLGFVPDVSKPSLVHLFDAASTNDPEKSVWPIAWALDWLQMTVTGAFGRITSVGPNARSIASLLKQRKSESYVKQQQQSSNKGFGQYHFGYASSTFTGSSVEHVILIDRDLDLVTPMLCQTTYHGVLADTVGIGPSGATKRGTKTSLKADPLFQTISDMGFAEACEYLHGNAKQLQEEYRAGNDLSRPGSTLTEIREVVTKLGSLQATQGLVDTHTELASIAMKQLETRTQRTAFDLQTAILDNRWTNTQTIAKIQDLIYRGAKLPTVLRLLVLLCLVRGGIKENILQAVFYGDILKTYGYDKLKLYHYLRNRGLLFFPRNSSFLLSSAPFTSLTRFSGENVTVNSGPQTDEYEKNGANSILDTPLAQTYSWYATNKSYKLYPCEGPDSSAYSGYMPLTARIAQMARGILPISKTILEPELKDEVFNSKDDTTAKEAKLRRTLMRNSQSGPHKPVILVVVIGGVTYAEAASIKAAISHDSGIPREVVVASSCVITGDDVVQC